MRTLPPTRKEGLPPPGEIVGGVRILENSRKVPLEPRPHRGQTRPTMNSPLTPRIVAVTGAAGALGSAVAERLVADGCRVALFDVESRLPSLKALTERLGPSKATCNGGDFAHRDAWEQALAELPASAKPTDAALIAGGWAGGAPLYSAEDDHFEAMLTANLTTARLAMKALLPLMVERGRGSIVVVGSRAVERPWSSENASAYATSKAALVAMAQTVAQEVLNRGVRVNAILPSTMDTHANRAAMPNADFSKWVSLASAAGVIAFLLSDDARDVSGAAIPVYGRA